ncbi:hypothetical protein Rhe02_09870 [Rhizocola hellebori]|uniref:Uncharacterized protein n=1 Tax=Rhizocola hellebori TaxID=1392758 RepID=A0A8J3VDQ1_9ACTN|nr:hypothetical protein [Rhizocola hellebori]GIH02920.1 hypothetical protein Rhe02_09870 [Rhizocola hellebori]
MNKNTIVMPALEDRVSDFGYGYRMRCECGAVSSLSAEDYYAEKDEAHMPCEHCPRSIHFGRAVAALRDEHDPALDNTRINTFAWYHTSTLADWPLAVDAVTRRTELAANAHLFHLPADHIERLVNNELNKALHVGTYGAAIENMLRRIRNQRDDPTAFYLHRVALQISPDRVNTGYRDENHEPVSQMTTMDLRAEGLDAVRYVNVYESMGSISLAVLPETIAWVQTLGLPISGLTPAHNAPLVEMLNRVQHQLDALRTCKPDTSAIRPSELRLMQLRGDPGPDGIAAASAAHGQSVRELHSEVTAALNQQYLTGISPRIADNFNSAIKWRSGQTASQFADFFAASAVALTRPDAVVTQLASRQPRPAHLGIASASDVSDPPSRAT